MDDLKILSYEEFKEQRREPKYFQYHCFCPGCDKKAEYEGGDVRFAMGVCEEHAHMKERYSRYVFDMEYKRRIRMRWQKGCE